MGELKRGIFKTDVAGYRKPVRYHKASWASTCSLSERQGLEVVPGTWRNHQLQERVGSHCQLITYGEIRTLSLVSCPPISCSCHSLPVPKWKPNGKGGHPCCHKGQPLGGSGWKWAEVVSQSIYICTSKPRKSIKHIEIHNLEIFKHQG